MTQIKTSAASHGPGLANSNQVAQLSVMLFIEEPQNHRMCGPEFRAAFSEPHILCIQELIARCPIGPAAFYLEIHGRAGPKVHFSRPQRVLARPGDRE